MAFLYLFAAFGLGALISMQPPINAHISAELGSPLLAASCSIAISLAIVFIARLATDSSVTVNWSRVFALPWWTLIGGAAGALFVIGALIVVPKLGVAPFFVSVVLGQLLGAAVIDQFGGFGITISSVTWPRVAGIVLVFLGAVLTQISSWR
ncbi:DMT family transporter [Phyllobacterium sp. P30BS-XVII]|uniref:DMT family transporter n=1 Tax=Phyllobacterium sp. P30BS-XVII TaxID=2587046 RepID=UPI0015FA2A4C|nr:DMT family transporter [Phyllobacterium sp. P30BS-XVII]MBA8903840.1 transporter family-2 protein [Phyllobacterium sp. P30BS-XVII]